MPSVFIPPKVHSSLSSPCSYITGTFKSSWHNLSICTDFTRITSIASDALELYYEPSCSKKAAHFFSHLVVGSLLLLPIINFVFFTALTCYEKEEILPEIKKEALPAPIPISLKEVGPSPAPKPSPGRSRVLERAQAIQQAEKALIEEKLHELYPVLDGKRANPVTIAQFQEIEENFTRQFFRLFPNETREPAFIGLRKKLEDSQDFFAPLYDDIEFIKSLYLNVSGRTPEERFKIAQVNLNTLYDFLNVQFSELHGEFYLEGNYKNDMQENIDNIPYVHIIKILFTCPVENFLNELEQCAWQLLSPINGERMAIRIDRQN